MKILIPTDFSENAFKAIDYVYSHFKSAERVVTVVHTITQPVSSSGVMLKLENLMMDDATNNMKKWVARIKEKYGDEPETIVRNGHLKDWLEQIVSVASTSLIVMATKGENDVKSKLMGSVTESIIRTSKVPVLAVPVAWEVQPMHRITIAAKGAQLEERAFMHHFIDRLETDHAKIEMLAVVKPTNNETLPRSIDLDGLQLNVQVQENNDVVDGINEYLENAEVDMLVMYHAHNRIFDYFFNRSVTKNICAKVEVPLLIIPEKR